MGMTLDRINEYFAFATSALVTGVGVMTVSENLADRERQLLEQLHGDKPA
ncbi:hypothetical protein ACMWE2_23280 [Klebsiella pneumoniae]